jgi:hypothetical protein
MTPKGFLSLLSYSVVVLEKTFSVYINSSKILSPCLGDKVDSGIGLSYMPTSLSSLTGQSDNPGSTISPSQGLRIWTQVSCFSFIYLLSVHPHTCHPSTVSQLVFGGRGVGEG